MGRRRAVEDAVKRARGARLAACREAARTAAGGRVTQAMLGRAIGRSGAQVSKYELGLDLLDAERTHQCAQALGCGFLDIFLGGRLELAEEAAPFVHEHAPQHGPELHGLLATARASLSPERQIILRDVVLELLKAQEAPPSVAPA